MALLASQVDGNDLIMFVVNGYEAHPDIASAELYLHRNGRKLARIECCEAAAIESVRVDAVEGKDSVQPCRNCRLLFWSHSPRNRMCAYCRKDEAMGDWDW